MLPGLQLKSGGLAADAMQRTAFRSSWTQPEGASGAYIFEGKVVDINLVLWTVDVISQFDQKLWLNIQIGAPYLHPNRGEGIYAMPDLGAKCHVCVPSDGPPPYVLDFIMPHETLEDVDTESTRSTASFAGGRTRAKPGDIYLRGRDGNYVVLHRGGVLQIGATQLAQRLYIPLQNLITDISQNYRHYNTGGSIQWFLAPGESENNPSTIWKQTYRLLAADEKASIRVAVGKLKDFVAEPASGAQSDIEIADVGTDDPIICEVVLAPEGFGADDGSIDGNTPKQSKLRFFFDKGGGTFLRCEGSVVIHTKKKLMLVAKDDAYAEAKNLNVTVVNTTSIDGGKNMRMTAGTITMQGGKNAAAHVGSLVETPLPVLTPVTPIPVLDPTGSTPIGQIPPLLTPIQLKPMLGTALVGTVTTGNATILI